MKCHRTIRHVYTSNLVFIPLEQGADAKSDAAMCVEMLTSATQDETPPMSNINPLHTHPRANILETSLVPIRRIPRESNECNCAEKHL